MKLSPHVSIYKFPITAISSILNRISGLVLSGGFVILGSSMIYPNFYNNLLSYNFPQKPPEKNMKKVIIFSGSLISTYHILGGIRHFIWDNFPKYLNNKSVKISSVFIATTSGVISLIVTKLS